MAASARRLSSLTRDAHKRFVPPSSSLFPLSPPVSAASPLPSFSSFFSPSRGSLPSSSTLASPPRPSSSLPSFSLSSSSPPSSSPPSSSLSLFASFFSLRFPSHAFSSLRKTKTETESGGEDDEQRAEKECSRSAFSSTLPPESHTRIAAIHKKLMTSPVVCAPLSEETKRACFPPLPEESFWRQRFDQIKDVLFLNDTLRHRGRLLLSSILPLYGDMNLLKTYFGIEEGSLSARLYFLVLHVWLLHRRLVALQEELTREALWEAVDDLYRAILSEEKVSEMRLSAYVREMQQTALGFCLLLDEAFDQPHFAGEAAHRIWYMVFEAKEECRFAPHVLDLTAYLLRTSQFVASIPTERLLRGSFSWPRWPPHLEDGAVEEWRTADGGRTFFPKA
ncbi:hypothetical protein TGVAND_215920 [Toxoplasma gondii VAND]|uniref:Ubiquinol-cytochrome c chaperone domain-containing protein n=1 Tax=Toxoplasma gondii VAND TaxID=933077 RepID=A0A086PL27_TOXGO|nr:hypothetical protein TGVAND_215920 [Toxoplasma gondii VAND]